MALQDNIRIEYRVHNHEELDLLIGVTKNLLKKIDIGSEEKKGDHKIFVQVSPLIKEPTLNEILLNPSTSISITPTEEAKEEFIMDYSNSDFVLVIPKDKDYHFVIPHNQVE